ncbi:hypothetical protein BMJ23_04995 [Sinorhizobium medicae]|nr:hypothetical protein BMJ23_04995 [Sinorhizobium medicae]
MPQAGFGTRGFVPMATSLCCQGLTAVDGRARVKNDSGGRVGRLHFKRRYVLLKLRLFLAVRSVESRIGDHKEIRHAQLERYLVLIGCRHAGARVDPRAYRQICSGKSAILRVPDRTFRSTYSSNAFWTASLLLKDLRMICSICLC